MSADDGGGPRALAREMFAQTLKDGQSARRVSTEDEATTVRQLVRQLGRTAKVRLRTARIDDVVVVARLDATLWRDDPQTMRMKLIPPA